MLHRNLPRTNEAEYDVDQILTVLEQTQSALQLVSEKEMPRDAGEQDCNL
jgi:hypothetical protein